MTTMKVADAYFFDELTRMCGEDTGRTWLKQSIQAGDRRKGAAHSAAPCVVNRKGSVCEQEGLTNTPTKLKNARSRSNSQATFEFQESDHTPERNRLNKAQSTNPNDSPLTGLMFTDAAHKVLDG
mmetsp:Transcript_26744/g.70225  ORF Transcript_26744/g.70225 Transcript_26744/m.70225 type:complete len:125 (+) Transcript_26744:3-377(+)